MSQFIDSATLLDLAVTELQKPAENFDFRLIDAKAANSALLILFRWKANPHVLGVRIGVPMSAEDDLWSRWDPGSLEEWVTYAVRVTLIEELQTGLTRRAARSFHDGVIWLSIDDTASRPSLDIHDMDPEGRALTSMGMWGGRGRLSRAAQAIGNLVLWRVALSADGSEASLGHISVVRGSVAEICELETQVTQGASIARALVADALYTFQDHGEKLAPGSYNIARLTEVAFITGPDGLLTENP